MTATISKDKKREWNKRYYLKHKEKIKDKYWQNRIFSGYKYIAEIGGVVYEFKTKKEILNKIKRVKMVLGKLK